MAKAATAEKPVAPKARKTPATKIKITIPKKTPAKPKETVQEAPKLVDLDKKPTMQSKTPINVSEAARKSAEKVLAAMAKAGCQKPYSGQIPGWVSTGCFIVDLVLSLGSGLPFSKFVHIFGKKHSGKTMLAIMLAIQVLKMGGVVYWHNQEDGWSDSFARLMGLDPDHPNFHLFPPELHQDCFDGIVGSVKALKGDMTPTLFVVDSLGGGCTIDRDTREIGVKKKKSATTGAVTSSGGRKGGDLPQVTKDFVNKTVPHLVHTMALVVVTNHTYLDYMAFTLPGMPKPEVPVGGGALPFRSIVEIHMSNPRTETDGKAKLKHGLVKIKTAKSKLIPKGLFCEIPIYFEQRRNRIFGIDDIAASIYYLVKQKVWAKLEGNLARTHIQIDTDEKGKSIYLTDTAVNLRNMILDDEHGTMVPELKETVTRVFRKQFGFD